MIEAKTQLQDPWTKHTLTSARRKEITFHQKWSNQLNIEIYSHNSHAPSRLVSNENTNVLLREYFPNGCDFSSVSDYTIQLQKDKLNNRPLKYLNWKILYELFYAKVCI